MGGILYAVSPIVVVILSDERGEEKFRFYPPDGRFTIRFLHSWARSPVDELFQVDAENNIVLKETIYEDFGAGLPHEPEPGRPMSSITVENGKIHIRGIDRIIPDLQIRTGRFVAGHTLVYEGKHVPFSNFAAPGSVVIFKAQRVKRRIPNFMKYVAFSCHAVL
ncbi:MAG: DUF1850 domain-containing protein [Synergistaceae bacterium]|nr:DUF1850 domain-containing protein [Synergistaceae bacterium]